MELCVYDRNQPGKMMSLSNMRNTLRALHQGDLFPLRPRATWILDDMEYQDNTAAQTFWSGTGITVATNSAAEQEGSYCLSCATDATANRIAATTQTLNLSGFASLKVWHRVNATSQAFKLYLKDGDGNISYWDLTSHGTTDTWKQDTLTLATPSSNNGTNADLSDIVEWGFSSLPASKTFLFDTVKAFAGMAVAIDAATIGSYRENVYAGQTRIAFAGGPSPTITAPAANPRIDLLCYNPTTGALAWTTGTEASSPAEPAAPSDKIPICLVYTKVGMTQVVNYEERASFSGDGYIYKDVRPLYGFVTIF